MKPLGKDEMSFLAHLAGLIGIEERALFILQRARGVRQRRYEKTGKA